MKNFMLLMATVAVITTSPTVDTTDISNVAMRTQYISDVVISEVEEEREATIMVEELTCELEHEEPMNESQITVEPSEVYLGTFDSTAYCSCEYCCGGGAMGITATGTYVCEGRTIAVDPNVIPLGSKVRVVIDGYSNVYTAEDTGGAIKGSIIDIYFASHQACINYGRRNVEVYLLT